MANQEQLDHFYRFATDQLANGGSEKSIDELYDQWRFENPTAGQQADIYAALDESLDDIENGHHRPADAVICELRAKYKLSE